MQIVAHAIFGQNGKILFFAETKETLQTIAEQEKLTIIPLYADVAFPVEENWSYEDILSREG